MRLWAICVFLLLFGLPFASKAAEICREPVISGPPYWPPFITRDEEGRRGGPAFDLATQILTPLAGTPVVDVDKPWNRVVSELETGQLDIIVAMHKTEERAQKFAFTNAWRSEFYAVVTLKGREIDYQDVTDLASYRGGMYAGVKLPEPFGSYVKDNGSVTQIFNIDSLFRMLEAQRVDYLIVAVDSFLNLVPDGMQREDFSEIESSRAGVPIHMAISRKSGCKDHLKEINAGIDAHLAEKNTSAIN
ncbi:substrate-binding periplasmic protein [Rhodovibrionaceae bacterium A322]